MKITRLLLLAALVAVASAGKKGKKGKHKGYKKGQKSRDKQYDHGLIPAFVYAANQPQATRTIPYPVPYPVYQRPYPQPYYPPAAPKAPKEKKIYVPVVKTVKVPVIIREKVHYIHTHHKAKDTYTPHKAKHTYEPPSYNSYHRKAPYKSSYAKRSGTDYMTDSKNFHRRSNNHDEYSESDVYRYVQNPANRQMYLDDLISSYKILQKYNLL